MSGFSGKHFFKKLGIMLTNIKRKPRITYMVQQTNTNDIYDMYSNTTHCYYLLGYFYLYRCVKTKN
jgi:hypothetical protein